MTQVYVLCVCNAGMDFRLTRSLAHDSQTDILLEGKRQTRSMRGSLEKLYTIFTCAAFRFFFCSLS